MDEKMDKVTTFKLTPELSIRLDAVCVLDGSSKNAVIRRLLGYGLLVHSQMQGMIPSAVDAVAKRVKVKRRDPMTEYKAALNKRYRS